LDDFSDVPRTGTSEHADACPAASKALTVPDTAETARSSCKTRLLRKGRHSFVSVSGTEFDAQPGR